MSNLSWHGFERRAQIQAKNLNKPKKQTKAYTVLNKFTGDILLKNANFALCKWQMNQLYHHSPTTYYQFQIIASERVK
jgi:predicted house-cleaning NTP pyrophosphatase (Maf/HAM1 superfamily)